MGAVVYGRDFRSRLGRFIHRLIAFVPHMSEDDPIGPDEWLLRRVPNRQPDYFNPALAVPVASAAFAPTKYDTDGISFFRELFVAPETVSMSGTKPPYIVVRLRSSGIVALGMTPTATPDKAGLPGHVSLPELAYIPKPTEGERKRQTGFRLGLVEIAVAVIVPTAV